MTREWVDDALKKAVDRRWVAHCDVGGNIKGGRCTTKTEPTDGQPPLADLVAAGWFVARIYGDVCPRCLAGGHQPTAEPHPAMTRLQPATESADS